MSWLVTMTGLMGGMLASALLIPGQWDLVILLGFVIGILVSETGMRIERRQPVLYSSKAKFEPQISVAGIRASAVGFGLLAGFAFGVQAYADVTRWAPPSIVSMSYFACATLVGLGLHLFVNARKFAQRKAPDWPAAKEASG